MIWLIRGIATQALRAIAQHEKSTEFVSAAVLPARARRPLSGRREFCGDALLVLRYGARSLRRGVLF